MTKGIGMLLLHPMTEFGWAMAYKTTLLPRYYSTFQILRKIHNVAYQLALPETSKIHDVFHISLLKQFKQFKGTPPVAIQAL